MVVGDFNGDAVPDLAVANRDSDNVSVLLGSGDGTFQTQRNLATGRFPFSVAVADFNGDGVADLAVANNGSDNVSVLLGNGDGSFQEGLNFSAHTPISLAVGDFNGDGVPDLAVTNGPELRSSDDVSVLLGKGEGTFRAARSFGGGNSLRSLAVGDFNGDGMPDLVVASLGTRSVSVLINNTTDSQPQSLRPLAEVRRAK